MCESEIQENSTNHKQVQISISGGTSDSRTRGANQKFRENVRIRKKYKSAFQVEPLTVVRKARTRNSGTRCESERGGNQHFGLNPRLSYGRRESEFLEEGTNQGEVQISISG